MYDNMSKLRNVYPAPTTNHVSPKHPPISICIHETFF